MSFLLLPASLLPPGRGIAFLRTSMTISPVDVPVSAASLARVYPPRLNTRRPSEVRGKKGIEGEPSETFRERRRVRVARGEGEKSCANATRVKLHFDFIVLEIFLCDNYGSISNRHSINDVSCIYLVLL